MSQIMMTPSDTL